MSQNIDETICKTCQKPIPPQLDDKFSGECFVCYCDRRDSVLSKIAPKGYHEEGSFSSKEKNYIWIGLFVIIGLTGQCIEPSNDPYLCGNDQVCEAARKLCLANKGNDCWG